MIASKRIDYRTLDKVCAWPGNHTLKQKIVIYKRKQRVGDLWRLVYIACKLISFTKQVIEKLYLPGGAIYTRAMENFNKHI